MILYVFVILLELRSFTSAERSRHAVELEKRAIRLFLEEGKEIFNILTQHFAPRIT